MTDTRLIGSFDGRAKYRKTENVPTANGKAGVAARHQRIRTDPSVARVGSGTIVGEPG
jgi:hypothetical protein